MTKVPREHHKNILTYSHGPQVTYPGTIYLNYELKNMSRISK